MSVKISGGKGLVWLENKKYPYSDHIALTESKEKYDDGSDYGVEIPVINSLSVLEDTIKHAHSSSKCNFLPLKKSKIP